MPGDSLTLCLGTDVLISDADLHCVGEPSSLLNEISPGFWRDVWIKYDF